MTSLPAMLRAAALVRRARLKEATDLIMTNLGAKAAAAPGVDESEAADGHVEYVRSNESRLLGVPAFQPATNDNHRESRRAGWSATDLLGQLRNGIVERRHQSPAGPTIPDRAKFLKQFCESPHGGMAYKLYVPSSWGGEPLPLLVMLHGCTQDPDDFAAGTQMNAVAEEQNLLVAYPAQSRSANASGCWNWFREGDQQRGAGEPAMIAAVTRQIMERYPVQRDRVYVAGLSAGGAAAAILGAAYPDLYAAIGVHSGLPCGAARDLASAAQAMRTGKSPSPISSFHRASPVRTIVFHGDRDKIVNPANSALVLAQFQPAETLGEAEIVQGRAGGGLAYTRTVHADADGSPRFEKWVIHGAGHAWSGGSSEGSHTEPRGPDASREMLRFFLDDRPQVR